MWAGDSNIVRGMYFVLVSTLFATVFYLCLGALFRYDHPFYNLSLFPVFLVGNALLGVGVFALSLRNNPGARERDIITGIGKPILILVSALVLSAVFPATAFAGLYPVSMAMFHLLILFYAGLALGALSLSGAVFVWRSGSSFSGLDGYVFPFALLVSLGISYMALHLFSLLTLS